MKKKSKHRKLLQGMGIGYVVCLVTHLIAALLPVYAILPIANRLGGHTHSHSHSSGVLGHLLTDILIFTLIILPVAVLTYVGHKVVRYFRCKCGTVHEKDPCDECPHRKF